MNITKTVGALAIVGVVAIGGAAFTAGGLALNPTTPDDAGTFIGGQLSQTVEGATLNSIAYGFTDPATQDSLEEITLIFAEDLETKAVSVLLDGAARGFTCPTKVYTTTTLVTCTTATPYLSPLANFKVTVAN